MDARPNESPREKWRRLHAVRKSSPTPGGSSASLKSTTAANVSLLLSGTLRGYVRCSRSAARALIEPNTPNVRLTLVTYDKNDCGGSAGHGLGVSARPIDLPRTRAAYSFGSTPVLVHNASAAQIDHFFHIYRRRPNLNTIFTTSVDRGAAVRYQSQFYLRHLASKLSRASGSDVVVLTRPDARLFGSWKIRRVGSQDIVALSIVLRDKTVCELKLESDTVLLPYSDIHSGSWDDTFAVGLGGTISKYTDLYYKLMQHAYSGPFRHPEALLRHHLKSQGLKIVDACGAARGDILELVKQC